MKGYLYAHLSAGRWSAQATIAPEVDLAFRLDPDFRAEAAALAADVGGDAGMRRIGPAEVVLLLDEPLPLGDAFAAAEMFTARAQRVQGEAAAVRLLRACVRASMSHGSGIPGRSRGDAPPAPAVRRLARTRAGGAVRASRHAAEARTLAAAALSAAAALAGRALLRSEARALLGAAGPAHARWSAGFVDAALQLAALLGRLRLGSAVARTPAGGRRRIRRCLRCGSGEAHLRRTACAACGRVCAYCEACLLLGRSRECTLLISGIPAGNASARLRPAGELAPAADRLARWGLSPAQSDAAAAALRWLEGADEGTRMNRIAVRAADDRATDRAANRTANRTAGFAAPISRLLRSASQLAARCGRDLLHPAAQFCPHSNTITAAERPPFLLWAVTGAGKSEMMYTLIDSVLARGGKALVATPRRDVVLELEPRIRRAFPGRTVTALHGASREKWTTADITLATTHQAIRFIGGFELVVIDELDAFPYHNNPMLQYAAAKCVKPGGHRVLLSATPPTEMRRAAGRGRLPHARVPVRFHGHPLPVPAELRIPSVRDMIRRKAVPDRLKRAVRASLSRGAQLFIFVPRIADTGPIASLLRMICPEGAGVGFTSSQDKQRSETVMRFRRRELRILVTTTILERGVTIPHSDVFVLDADAPLFDEASLEQMAGRAGRSPDDPDGRVYFCAPHATRAQRAAIREIRAMNALAAARGYIRQEARSKRNHAVRRWWRNVR